MKKKYYEPNFSFSNSVPKSERYFTTKSEYRLTRPNIVTAPFIFRVIVAAVIVLALLGSLNVFGIGTTFGSNFNVIDYVKGFNCVHLIYEVDTNYGVINFMANIPAYLVYILQFLGAVMGSFNGTACAV